MGAQGDPEIVRGGARNLTSGPDSPIFHMPMHSLPMCCGLGSGGREENRRLRGVSMRCRGPLADRVGQTYPVIFQAVAFLPITANPHRQTRLFPCITPAKRG